MECTVLKGEGGCHLGGSVGLPSATYKDSIKEASGGTLRRTVAAALGVILASALLFATRTTAVTSQQVAARRQAVLMRASRLLDEAQVSYVYGGHQLGDSEACNQCNTCLEQRRPAPTQRLRQCPACKSCSLDCSHFTALVFAQAKLPYPYLDTATMLSLSAPDLFKRYHFVDLGVDLRRAGEGDLLVYPGHVVLLEKVTPATLARPEVRGDVVHATGGKDIRRPGEGIQRERFVDLASFRGPLLRILRHAELQDSGEQRRPPLGRPVLPSGRLRPVAVHGDGDLGGG